MGMRNILPTDEVAIVFTVKVQIEDPDNTRVVETLNTPFYGPSARGRATNFMADPALRADFPEADGWHWHIWANKRANEVYGAEMTKAMLGED